MLVLISITSEVIISCSDNQRLLITKQDACSGVHSACRREEMCTTPSTAQAGANAGTSRSYGGGGGVLIFKYGI